MAIFYSLSDKEIKMRLRQTLKHHTTNGKFIISAETLDQTRLGHYLMDTSAIGSDI